MTPDRWRRIEELYQAVQACGPETRLALLAQADTEIRREVESLLAQDAATLLEHPAWDLPALQCSARLGPYEIISKLGAGGMGEVYRAHDARLGRDVAIKVLSQHLSRDPQAVARFEREAKAVAALSHPNILAIYDVGAEQGITYAVTELLEGETLRSRLERSALSWQTAAEIGASMASGIAAAHSKGITHRDLKPENVFITQDGVVKVLDFGLARWRPAIPEPRGTDLPTETQPGVVMGTVGYMSPEQVRGGKVDAPSDIFALGCVLYEMVAGRRAFARETPVQTMTAILEQEPAPLTSATGQVPEELVAIITRCLKKRETERVQSARDVMLALTGLQSGAKSSPQSVFRPIIRRTAAISAGALLFFALLASAVYWFRHGITSTGSIAVLPFTKAYASHCTSWEHSGIRGIRCESLKPCAFLGASLPGGSYRHSGLSV